jgi:hypothetical protein
MQTLSGSVRTSGLAVRLNDLIGFGEDQVTVLWRVYSPPRQKGWPRHGACVMRKHSVGVLGPGRTGRNSFDGVPSLGLIRNKRLRVHSLKRRAQSV